MYARKKSKEINSNCVKGLLVGINYRGTSNALGGCINDVLMVKDLLLKTYPTAKLELLTDDTYEKPTRNNILKKLTNLVDEAIAGDILIFHYSGHGSQVKDLHGDEEDGYDETICPIDFMQPRVITYKGKKYRVDSQIIDDEINEILVKVPRNVKLLMLSDSCHSGTIGDLKNNLLNYVGPEIWENFNLTDNKITNSLQNVSQNTIQAITNNDVLQPEMQQQLSQTQEVSQEKIDQDFTPLQTSLEFHPDLSSPSSTNPQQGSQPISSLTQYGHHASPSSYKPQQACQTAASPSSYQAQQACQTAALPSSYQASPSHQASPPPSGYQLQQTHSGMPQHLWHQPHQAFQYLQSHLWHHSHNAYQPSQHGYHHQLLNQLFHSSPAYTSYNRFSENVIINCSASVVYVKDDEQCEIWITPLDTGMFTIFNNKKHILELNVHQVPDLLLQHPWHSFIFNVAFNKLNEDKYLMNIDEIGLENIIIQPSLGVSSLAANSLNSPKKTRNLGVMTRHALKEEVVEPCTILSHYDVATGKHEHVNCTTGEKCTLNMRSPSSCHGGELRIISGCRDNQTSADTGKNGACTLAFLNTIKMIGGLENFFNKIFSHHIEDLRIIQDNINKFLTKYGFTQQSMVSWDHSAAERNLFGSSNTYNSSSTSPKVLYGFNNLTRNYNINPQCYQSNTGYSYMEPSLVMNPANNTSYSYYDQHPMMATNTRINRPAVIYKL